MSHTNISEVSEIKPSANALCMLQNFILPSEITVNNVEAIADQIIQLNLSDGTILTLDASSTKAISTSGIQLLLSLEKTLEQLGGQLKLVNVNNSITQILSVMGFKSKLEKWGSNE